MEFENVTHSVNIPSLERMNTNINPANDAGTPSFRKSSKVSPEVDGIQLKSKYHTKMTIFVLIKVLILLLISGFLAASLVIRVLKAKLVGGLEIWKWCLFGMSVLSGFSIVLWVYWPIMFLVEKAFELKQEVIYFVYGLRKSGAFFVWWVWVLLMWLILMRQQIKQASPKATKILKITTLTLISLTVGSFAWMVLTVGLRLLSVKCRFNRYIKKVKGIAFELEVLRCLAGEPLSGGSDGLNCYPFSSSSKASNNKNADKLENEEFARIYTLNSNNLNFLNWDYIFDHVHQSLELSSLKGISNISTDKDASKVASYVFANVLRNSPHSECITIDDMSQFIKDKDKINLVLDLFGANDTQSIDRKPFTNWVVSWVIDDLN